MRGMSLCNKGIILALFAAACLFSLLFYTQKSIFNNAQVAASDPDDASSLQTDINTLVIGYLADHIKRNKESELLQTDLSEQELIARFLDESAPLATRKLDAWRLAVLGTDNAKQALLSVLQNGSAAMRAIVAEMLGHSRWPEVPDILGRLLSEENPLIARGAVSGLVLFGGKQSVSILRNALLAETTDPALRSFIASRLGDIQTAEALAALKTAFSAPSLPEETLRNLVASLGKFPFKETADLFRQTLADPSLSAEFKAEATESLIKAGKGSLAFLNDLAADHADPKIRASAAWAAGAHPNTGNLGGQLAPLLQSEANDEVRRRLYEAMMRQTDIPAASLLNQALAETGTATRVAAANMLAMALQQSDADSALQRSYDARVVPQLLDTALSDASLNLRYRAVFALARAGTGTAVGALQTIERQGDPQIADLAARKVATLSH